MDMKPLEVATIAGGDQVDHAIATLVLAFVTLPIELAREKRIYVTAPSAKVRPPDPRPRYGFPPANAGALGAAGSVLLFVKFVRSPRCTRGHFVDRCNLAATMW